MITPRIYNDATAYAMTRQSSLSIQLKPIQIHRDHEHTILKPYDLIREIDITFAELTMSAVYVLLAFHQLRIGFPPALPAQEDRMDFQNRP